MVHEIKHTPDTQLMLCEAKHDFLTYLHEIMSVSVLLPRFKRTAPRTLRHFDVTAIRFYCAVEVETDKGGGGEVTDAQPSYFFESADQRESFFQRKPF